MKTSIDPDLCTACETGTEAHLSLYKLGSDWIAETVHDVVPSELEAEAMKAAGLESSIIEQGIWRHYDCD